MANQEAWISHVSPYWRRNIVRGIAAGGLMGIGGLIIAAALTQILVVGKPVPDSWFLVLTLGGALGVIGLGLTLPTKVWVFLKDRIIHRSLYQMVSIYISQHFSRDKYLHLHDTQIFFLSRSGGQPIQVWKFETFILSQLLQYLQVTSYVVEIVSSIDADLLAGISIRIQESLAFKPLDRLQISQHQGGLPDAAFNQLRELVKDGGHRQIWLMIRLTGYNGTRKVFRIKKPCQATVGR